MALDLAILNETGKPQDQISLGVGVHKRLMIKAKENNLAYILRLWDYYSDADFHSAEIDDLLSEIIKLKDNIGVDEELLKLLEGFLNLGLKAKTLNQGIVAIAD